MDIGINFAALSQRLLTMELEEELDFIINYDIKYRMGDELNEDIL